MICMLHQFIWSGLTWKGFETAALHFRSQRICSDAFSMAVVHAGRHEPATKNVALPTGFCKTHNGEKTSFGDAIHILKSTTYRSMQVISQHWPTVWVANRIRCWELDGKAPCDVVMGTKIAIIWINSVVEVSGFMMFRSYSLMRLRG